MEEEKDEADSTMNDGEARVAIEHAKRLIEGGVQAGDIGIITPYSAQVLFCLYHHFRHLFVQSIWDYVFCEFKLSSWGNCELAANNDIDGYTKSKYHQSEP